MYTGAPAAILYLKKGPARMNLRTRLTGNMIPARCVLVSLDVDLLDCAASLPDILSAKVEMLVISEKYKLTSTTA